MEQGDIKYIYEIGSSINYEEVIDVVSSELNCHIARVEYFDLAVDDVISKDDLSIKDVKEDIFEPFSEDQPISVLFPDAEIIIGDDYIEISSRVKLKLDGIDEVKEVKK